MYIKRGYGQPSDDLFEKNSITTSAAYATNTLSVKSTSVATPNFLFENLYGRWTSLASSFTTGMSPRALTIASMTTLSGEGTKTSLRSGHAMSFRIRGTRPITNDVAMNCDFRTSCDWLSTHSAHHQHADGHFLNGV
ncbi:hypothetical protein OEA41_002546 [Lepraria neglecta]|uniref:Uncharacterized protein n=1 Tax=Lepraria neglecta TaxID=209136 RepID=A0AAD9ZC39_9LECA|nr:hypothetical protein OEA41_002546 [Lepraria neglecta]